MKLLEVKIDAPFDTYSQTYLNTSGITDPDVIALIGRLLEEKNKVVRENVELKEQLLKYKKMAGKYKELYRQLVEY